MGRESRIKDVKRAVDAGDLMKRARRNAVWKLLFQLLMWALLAAVIVLLWRCLTGILDYAGESEVPMVERSAPGEGP
jgi:hypothetical protein